MTNTKRWKVVLVVLCAVFALTLAMAILFGIDWQSSAKADEATILPENTATYTIADVASKSFSTYNVVKYDKNTNEWNSDYAKNFELLLTVTQVPEAGAGSIAFEWKVAKVSSSHKLIVKKYPDGQSDQAETIIEKVAASSNTYEKVTIDNVVVGDQISIFYTSDYSYRITLCGLEKPTEQFEFTAKISEGAEHGTIEGDRPGEKSDEQGVLTFSRGYCESYTLTAKPDEGYVVFWQRETDARAFYSAENEISNNNVQINNKGEKYFVYFLKLDNDKSFSSTWQSPVEEELGWIYEDDKYQAKNVDGIDYHSSSTLTVVAKGEAYLKFTYAFSSDSSTYSSRNPTLHMTINGQQDKLVDYSMPTTYILGAEIKEVTGYIHLSKEGLNVVDIQLSGPGAIGYNAAEGSTVYFKDFEVVTEDDLPERQVHFHYNPNYADLTINNEPIQESAEGIVDYIFTAKISKPFTYSIKAKSDVISSIDNGTVVKTQFVSVDTNTNYDYWSEKEENVGFFAVDYVTVGGSHLTMNEDAEAMDNDLHLRFEYQEYAPKTSVTASKTENGQVSEIDIKDGSTVEFPYNKDNSIIIRILNFDKILIDEITVKINGEIFPSNKITRYGDYFGFVVDDVKQKNIEISYSKEGYNCTNDTISFKLREVYQGTINDIVTLGNIEIEDVNPTQYGELVPWVFSPTYSEGDTIAFLAGNSMYETGESYDFAQGGGISVLAFHLSETDAGVLSFEYKMKGIYENFFDVIISRTQAWYRFGDKFSDEEINLVESDGNKTGNIAWEHETSLLAKAVTDGGGAIEYGDASKPVGKTGWYRVSIHVPQDRVSDTVYLAFYARSLSDKSTQSLAIRNVNYISGMATANIKIVDSGKGSVSTTLNGEESKTATPGETITYTPAIGDTLTLKAIAGGDTFYGWTVNGEWFSEKEETSYIVDSAETEIVAYIMPKGFYEARHGGTFYRNLVGDNGALTKVAEGQIVITTDSLVISGNVEIPKGVSLVLPYSANGEYTRLGNSDNSSTQIAWATPGLEQQYKYFTLTIDENATLRINGNLYIGGVLNYPAQSYQGYTSGAYSHLVNNGTIVVEDGGVMDVYGRVTGEGAIDVKSGAKLYEPFLILDFAGGNNTLDTFSAKSTPFKRYAMINIENTFTIHSGAQLIGHATLYALNMFVSLDQPFISDERGDGRGHDTMIMLKDKASVTATYDPDTVVEGTLGNCTELIGRTNLTFTGGAKFSYMLFSALGFNVPTTSVYFSIPYNFDLTLASGDYETVTDFMIMPGATVTVAEDAKLTLNANAWVYDGLQAGDQAGKSYPSAQNLESKGLSKSGNLIINGTLVLGTKQLFNSNGELTGQSSPITFLGIVQTSGKTGRIEVGAGVTLKGSICDGLKDQNYFEYSSSARVWDAAHNCFGNLVAGHTYTATGGGEFRLETLQYATAPNAKADQLLDLTDQVLHGSWMVEHGEEHKFDWSPIEEDSLGGGNYKQLTRTCTELGCDHKAHKDLFAELQDLGNATYKGSAFTQDDILAQLKTLFGIEGGAEGMFEIVMPTIENANTYQITLKLLNGFWLNGGQYDATDRTWNFTVDRRDVNDQQVTVTAPQDVEFNGQMQQFDPVVQFNGVALAKGTDFSLAFDGDATNAGTITITVTGQNNFVGSKKVTYQITAKQLADGNLTLTGVNNSYEYNAQAHKPVPSSVLVDGLTLTDFDIVYTSDDGNNCVNVGNVTITVTPKQTNKNFAGSAQFTFAITAKNASAAQVTVEGEYDYTGKAHQPNEQVKVKLEGFELTSNDFDIVFDSNTETGNANVTVNFKGNFSGTAKGTFVISKRDVGKLTVEGIDGSYEFAGRKIQPQITVKNGETLLEATTDYTVQYGENTNVGKGTVTVTGVGKHFEGTKEFSFDITPKDASQAEVTVSGSYVYNAQQHDVKVNVSLDGYTFEETRDYTIVYADSADRTNAGSVGFSVRFNNNFSGTVADKSFTIERAAVKVTPQNAESPEGENQALLSFSISGTMYGNDKTTLEGAISVKIENDADVSQGKAGATFNIVVVYGGNAQLDKNYNIDVSAKGTYTITEAVFKDVTFNDSSVDYDGAAHGIEATNLPQSATATYEYKIQNGAALEGQPKNVGIYEVTVTIKLESYKPLVLKRTLTIVAKKVQVTVSDQTVTYNGKPQQAQNDAQFYSVPKDAIVNGDQVIFAIGSDQITNVGSKEIKLTVSGSAKDNYDISNNTAHFIVQALAIAQEGVQVTSKHVFNGKVQTPDLLVTAGGITLNAQQDFDVTYAGDRTNAGDYTVTVQAKGNFSGSVTVSFNIAKAQLTNVDATGNGVFDGKDKTPALAVSAEGGLTVGSGDYSVAYKGDRKNVGKFTVEVTATGSNYTGTVSTQFEVTPAHLDSVKDIGDYTFNRQEQKPLLEVKAGNLTLAEGDFDISLQSGSLTNAGSAVLQVKAKGNFDGTQTVSITIKPATVNNVEVTGTYEYDGTAQTPQLTVKAGDIVLESTEYKLDILGNSTNSGTVQFSVQGLGNFDGSQNGSFEIQRKKVQVTVNDGESTYGDGYEELTFSHEGLINDTDLIMSDIVELVCESLKNERAAAGTYDIVANVTQPDQNYTLEVVRQGRYTVNKRNISVTVNDQFDVFGFGKDYKFNPDEWKVTDGKLLDGDVLFKLVKPQFVNAGDYEIDVTNVNANYNVTFIKGTYKIDKLHVEHDGNETLFVLSVNGEEFNEENPERYKYNGEDALLSATVFVTEGNAPRALQVKLSQETISQPGVFEIVVTIDDVNYEGSHTFNVEFVRADGYSQRVHDALVALQQLAGDLSANTLTSSEEHFAIVNGIVEQFATLEEQDFVTYEQDLAKYVEIVDAWNNAADISPEVISTAKAIADAPIKWLVAVAAANALLAAMFVFGKGGLL